jgi:CubicO group peptidase (beta-lactamase class C family)
MKTTLRLITLIYVSFVLFTACKNAPDVQISNDLPRSTPTAEGVSAKGILQFLDSAAATDHEFHSIMILRHGKVVAEGWWSPYNKDLRHTLYSTSKSFTSTAVGFAVNEKLLTVNDKVVSFFPEELPDTVSPYLAELTIKDLLTMSVGQDPDPTSTHTNDTNWVRAFLAIPILNKPGTKFLYNSMATYMLSAIIQKVTGEKIIDYLTPRLFEPLGIQGMDWELDPMGINTGGWGLRVKTEDMAKFGLLYLQKGKWNEKQIIPESWVDEATTFKIDQAPDAPKAIKDSNDWMQGYCYQFWRCRNNAFRADGAFGQYIVVIPDKDAVIAITSESSNMGDQLNMIWSYLFPALKDEPLMEDDTQDEILKQRLASLLLPMPAGQADSPLAAATKGKTFLMDQNNLNIQSINIDFAGDTCLMALKTNNIEYILRFGSGKWIDGTTGKTGPNLSGLPGGLDAFKITSSYCWLNDKTLELTLRYIESPHHETYRCTFGNDRLLMNYAPSVAFGKSSVELNGRMVSKEQ